MVRKIESELMTGTYQMKSSVLWDDFVKEYTRRTLEGKVTKTREEALAALAHFKRLVKPVRVFAIDTSHVDDYTAARRKEASRYSQSGEPVSPATVNKELRHIKAALGKAKKWGYIKEVPDFEMELEPGKLPTYLPPDHFALVYQACDKARWPDEFPFTAADWWRGLLMTGYMTGWRIGELLALCRADVDLDAGTAIGRAGVQGNKAKQDVLISLNPVVIEHLRRLASFDPCFFPWNHGAVTCTPSSASCKTRQASSRPPRSITASTTCAGRSPP
jgi:integrase